MKILRTYILKEFINPLFLSLGVLTFVMLMGNLIQMTDLVINRGVEFATVGKLFFYMIPALLKYTLPIAALTATLLSLGRFSSDNEVIALRASGIHLFSLILPLLVVGTIISLLLVIFNDRVIPYAHYSLRKTLIDVGIKNPAAALEPGIFINSFDKYILFIYRIDQRHNRMHNVRIYQPQEGKPTRTIVAKEGEFIAVPEQNLVKLKLMNGTSDEPDPGNPKSFYKLNFQTYFMSLRFNQATDASQINKKPKDMTIFELRQEAAKLQKEAINPLPLFIEIYEKITLSFASLVFILLGSGLAMITRRREKSLNFGIAFVIAGLYYLMLIGAEALCLQGTLSPAIAMWAPNIIMGGTGIFLLLRLCAS